MQVAAQRPALLPGGITYLKFDPFDRRSSANGPGRVLDGYCTVIEPRPTASGEKAKGRRVSQVTPEAPRSVGKPGRKPSSAQTARDAAIQALLNNDVHPAINTTWPKFRHEVRVRGGGFDGDPKNEKYNRGFSDTTITRITRRLMKRQA